MGAEVTKTNKRNSGETGEQTTGKEKRGGYDTGTGTAETGRTDTGRSKAGRAGADTAEVKSTDSMGLAEVNTAVPTPEPKSTATKRKRKKKAVKPPTFSSEQISALIMAMSGIMASRPDFAIFALSEAEAQQLAQPIANIIENTGYSEAVGKYADHIALITACLMIFAPRIIVFSQQQKAKKIEKNGGLKLEPVKERKSHGDSAGDNKPTPDTEQNSNNAVLSSIPSLA